MEKFEGQRGTTKKAGGEENQAIGRNSREMQSLETLKNVKYQKKKIDYLYEIR